MRRRIVAIGLAVVLAAACGGDDADPEADEDAAERAIEAFEDRLSDDGYSLDEDEDDDEDQELEAQSEACEDVVAVLNESDGPVPDDAPGDESDPYTIGEIANDGSGGSTTVEGEVSFAEDAGDLEEAFEFLSDDDLEDCFAEAFESSLEQQENEGTSDFGVEDIDVDIDQIDGLGEEAASIGLEAFLIGGGLPEPLPFTAARVFARDGRIAVETSSTAIGPDPPDADLEELTELLLDEAN